MSILHKITARIYDFYINNGYYEALELMYLTSDTEGALGVGKYA
jgi:hypothetical protein